MNSEKQVFKTKYDNTFIILHLAILAAVILTAIYAYNSASDKSSFSLFLGFWIVALIFTFSSFLLLKIIIIGDKMIVQHFFSLYKLDIKTITKIKKGETMWFGLHKHGTSRKGLIISSKFKNDLYITPQNEEVFFQKLLQINPNISIEKADK